MFDPELTRKAIATAGALLVGLLAYLLSYAPVVRSRIGADPPVPPRIDVDTYLISVCDGDDMLFYQPVDWMIDHTPLRKPLMAWADVWGVDLSFSMASLMRKLDQLQAEYDARSE